MSLTEVDLPVEVASPAPRDVWHRAVMADTSSTPASTPEWADSIIDHAQWHDASRAYSFASGRTVVVPMVSRRVADVRLADRAWPEGWSFGPPIAEGGLRPQEVEVISRDIAASRTPSVSIPFRGTPPEAPVQRGRVTEHPPLVVDLSAGFESYLAHGMSKNGRKALHRAEREALQIRQGNDTELLAAFATLSQLTTDRWAKDRGQPLAIARALADRRDRPGRLASAIKHFGPDCQVWVAWRDGTAVSTIAAVYGEHRGVAWMSAIDKDALGASQASILLATLAIREAHARGLAVFEFGESDPGSGAEAFKQRLGAVRNPLWLLTAGWFPVEGMQNLGRAALGRLKGPED